MIPSVVVPVLSPPLGSAAQPSNRPLGRSRSGANHGRTSPLSSRSTVRDTHQCGRYLLLKSGAWGGGLAGVLVTHTYWLPAGVERTRPSRKIVTSPY